MEIQAICLFGPPGAGKGLQANILKSYPSIYHISTGDIFRSIPKDHSFAKLQQSYLSKGEFVPDDITLDLVQSYIKGLIQTFKFNPNEQVILLDGLPRTPKQVTEVVKRFNIKSIISLRVDDQEVLIKRLLNRATIEGRSDDGNLQTVKRRLELYLAQTAACLDLFQETHAHCLSSIDGNRPCSEVTLDILSALAPWLHP